MTTSQKVTCLLLTSKGMNATITIHLSSPTTFARVLQIAQKITNNRQFKFFRNVELSSESLLPANISHLTITDAESIDTTHTSFYALVSDVNNFPDYTQYSLSRVEVTNIKRTFTLLVKVLGESEEAYHIKLLAPSMLNWGSGPTLPSIYAILFRDGKVLVPYLETVFDLEYLLIRDLYKYENPSYCNVFWKQVEGDPCSVCLDREANTFAYCASSHLLSCSQCAPFLDKCPICREEVITYRQLESLELLPESSKES